MLKLKARNGYIFNLEKVFKNDNEINFWMNYYSWGLGFNYHIGDSRRFFQVDLLCFHLDIWH